MSEQDKRAVYMGTFERHKKEVSVKLEDIVTQITSIKSILKYSIILGGVALGIAISTMIAI